MAETYREEQEANIGEDQKDKDIQLILELKKLKWVLENEGYVPTLEEAINRISSKYEDEETMESMMDDDSDEAELESDMDNYPEGFGDNGF